MTIAADRIRSELSSLGIEIDNIYDLVNSRRKYTAAIPLLVELLDSGITDEKLKEGVIRALAVKEAQGLAGPTLLREFHRIPKEAELLRWAIGNAMAVVITDDCTDAVLEIALDVGNGSAREMFVLAIGKLKSEKAEQALIYLLRDEEVVAHALDGLGKMRSAKARESIRELLNHSRSLVRKEARRALKRIGE